MILHLRRIREPLRRKQSTAAIVFVGKLGAAATSQSNTITPRTKRIYVKLHNVRSLVVGNEVGVQYNVIETDFLKAGIQVRRAKVHFKRSRAIRGKNSPAFSKTRPHDKRV